MLSVNLEGYWELDLVCCGNDQWVECHHLTVPYPIPIPRFPGSVRSPGFTNAYSWTPLRYRTIGAHDSWAIPSVRGTGGPAGIAGPSTEAQSLPFFPCARHERCQNPCCGLCQEIAGLTKGNIFNEKHVYSMIGIDMSWLIYTHIQTPFIILPLRLSLSLQMYIKEWATNSNTGYTTQVNWVLHDSG